MTSARDELPTLREVQAATENGELPALVERLASAHPSSPSAWLARALRVDLALLQRDPSFAYACVHNRGWWLGAPEAAPFRKPSRKGTELRVASPLLRGLLARWARERTPRPWARALRPLCHSLESALREEYRAAYALADSTLAFVDDARLLVAGGVAWDRSRALRVQRAASAPSWQLDRRAPRGRCRVLDRMSGAVWTDVPLGADDTCLGVAITEDARTVFAGGWFEDYDGVVSRIDRTSGRLVWRAELAGSVTVVAVDQRGDRVAALGAGHVSILDGASGAVLGSAPLSAHQLALDASGRWLATLDARRLRVWDVDALIAHETSEPTGMRGWIAAAFSPDATRLLTGGLLVDAGDGRVIAPLDVDWGGYLEGGPPTDARALGDDRFVELSPHGVRAWDTRAGALVVNDEAARYMVSRDTVSLALDGRRFARARRSSLRDAIRELAVWRVDDGACSAPIAGDDITCFSMAPSGDELATGHEDGRVRLWRTDDGVCVETSAPASSAIAAVCFAPDGARLVIGLRGAGLVALDPRRGLEVVGERALSRADPHRSTRARDTDAWEPEWSGGRAALELLHGWCGIRTRAHPYVAIERDGLTSIEDERGLDAPVVIANEDALVIDPVLGRAVASRYEHYAIERE